MSETKKEKQPTPHQYTIIGYIIYCVFFLLLIPFLVLPLLILLNDCSKPKEIGITHVSPDVREQVRKALEPKTLEPTD